MQHKTSGMIRVTQSGKKKDMRQRDIKTRQINKQEKVAHCIVCRGEVVQKSQRVEHVLCVWKFNFLTTLHDGGQQGNAD